MWLPLATQAETALARARQSAQLVELAARMNPPDAPALAAAMITAAAEDPILAPILIEIVSDQERATTTMEREWARSRPTLLTLYRSAATIVARIRGTAPPPEVQSDPPSFPGLADRPPVGVHVGDQIANAAAELIALSRLLALPEPWFSCPRRIVLYLPMLVDRLAALCARERTDAPPNLRDSVKSCVSEVRRFADRQVAAGWAAIFELAAEIEPSTLPPMLAPFAGRCSAFSRPVPYPEWAGWPADPSASATAEPSQRGARLVVRAQLVATQLGLALSRGLHARSALVRYKLRAEHYEWNLLKEQLGERGEAALRADVARFLFDQGYFPLMDSPVGTFRPDILEATATREAGLEDLVLEVKATDRADEIVEGFLQAVRYARRRESHRAYYVIFNGTDSAEWDVPRIHQVGDIEVWTIQIDISGQPARSKSAAGRLAWEKILAALAQGPITGPRSDPTS